MRLGLMGGTFDPIHMGHLLAAEEALERCRLDEVMFAPAGRPWMKEGEEVSAAHHRMNMATLAASSNPRFSVSSVEVDREGLTYTVDTLEELNRDDPSRELFLIAGADSLVQMNRWKQPERIRELCTVVAVPRPGYDVPNAASRADESTRVIYLEAPLTAISATEVRERVSRGLTVGDWVPEAVEAYIHRHGLYGSSQRAGDLSVAEGRP